MHRFARNFGYQTLKNLMALLDTASPEGRIVNPAGHDRARAHRWTICRGTLDYLRHA